MSSNPRLIQPRHPTWPDAKLNRFSDHYDLLTSVSYPLYDIRPEKRYFGGREPRQCALCGRAGPDVEFRSEAHALPAALGNRRLISLEECDNCNSLYSSWENELTNLFAPQRIVGRVAARQGWPKLSPRGLSTIEASATGISIHHDERDSSIQLDVKDKSAALTLSCPAYSPVKAGLALLRSLWLVMGPQERQRSKYVLSAIREGPPTNTQLMRFTSTGSLFQEVRLSGWTKQQPGVVPGAVFILQFLFFDTALAWLWPDESGVAGPSLIPPFPSNANSVRGGTYVLRDAEHRVDEVQATYHFTFDGRVESLTQPSLTRTERPAAPRVTVHLETEHQGHSFQIETTLLVDSWEPSSRVLRLQGGSWPGRITLEMDEGGQDGSFSFRFIHYAAPPVIALAAAEFLDALRQSRSFRVRLADTGTSILQMTLNPETFPAIQELPALRDLALVQTRLGRDIRIPKKRSAEFFSELAYVASVLRTGTAERPGGTLTMTVTPSEASTLEGLIQAEQLAGHAETKLQIRGASMMAILDSVELDMGTCTQTFFITRVSCSTLEQGKTRVEAAFSRVLDSFDQWASTGR